MTATYRGDANGAYLAGGADASYFDGGRYELTAEFQNAGGTNVTGSNISRAQITNIVSRREIRRGQHRITGLIPLATT